MKLLIVANFAKEHINKFHIPTIKKFVDAGWQVDVACRADADVPYCSHLYDIGCVRNPFHPLSIAAVNTLKKVIENSYYDCIHCHTLTGRYIGTMAAKRSLKKGIKLIVTYHGFNFYKGSSPLTKVLIPAENYMAKYIDLAFFNNSEDIQFAKRFQLGKSVFCPPSINESKYIEKDKHRVNRHKTREQLGFDPSDIVLTYVAELNKNKNQMLLLNTLSILKQRNIQCKLMLIGPDHSSGVISSAIKKKGLSDSVLLLGWRESVCSLLCASDIYVASSIREGFGVNLLEAIICELPILATNNRGHREIVIDGFNGYLCPLGMPEIFAEKVAKLISDKILARTFIENGIKRYYENFSRKTEDIIFEEYKKIIY